jgi:hypothetical protein
MLLVVLKTPPTLPSAESQNCLLRGASPSSCVDKSVIFHFKYTYKVRWFFVHNTVLLRLQPSMCRNIGHEVITVEEKREYN